MGLSPLDGRLACRRLRDGARVGGRQFELAGRALCVNVEQCMVRDVWPLKLTLAFLTSAGQSSRYYEVDTCIKEQGVVNYF